MTHMGKNIIEQEQVVRELQSFLGDSPIFIHVPPKMENYIIDVSDYISGDSRGARVSIFVGNGSSARLAVHGDKTRACVFEFILADYATVFCEMNHVACSPSLRGVQATVGLGSHFSLREEIRAESFFYSRCDVVLKGAGSSFKDVVRYRGSARSEIDMERAARHAASRTASFLDARGVAGGETKVKWRGKVRVEKQASKASAFQRHDAIVAGSLAQVDSAPILEIYTHDISCKHSASIQRINPEQVFYFESRGLDEKESRKEILDGFLAIHNPTEHTSVIARP